MAIFFDQDGSPSLNSSGNGTLPLNLRLDSSLQRAHTDRNHGYVVVYFSFFTVSDGKSTQGSNPPAPNPSVILPAEILDKILERIPAHKSEWQTLIACALVATWWTGPSQRRPFSVSIDGDNHQRWVSGVVHSGSKARLLGHVRLFSHRRSPDIGTKYPMRDLARDSGEYLSALRNIHSLRLHNIRFEHLSEDQFRTCFSAFRETLTHLSLETVTTSIGAFVALVDYFPNIRTLQLCSFVLEPDEGPVPPLSQPFRGKLHVWCFRWDRLEFFDRFAKLDLEYEELVITPFTLFANEMEEFLESALQTSTSTVKFLRLHAEFECKCS